MVRKPVETGLTGPVAMALKYGQKKQKRYINCSAIHITEMEFLVAKYTGSSTSLVIVSRVTRITLTQSYSTYDK